MKVEDLRSFLKQWQVDFREKSLPHGVQLRCREGETFNVYESGKVVCGGAKSALTQAVQEMINKGALAAQAFDEAKAEVGVSGDVFIVYGHDTAARDTLELLIRRMGLNPIVLQHLPAAGDTIIEKLEQYLGERGNVGFACVLLTPDDEGHKVGCPDEKKYRARQNVVLELGMVLSGLDRKRVAILHKGSIELPSDISGLIYLPFVERVDEMKNKLFRELQQAGHRPRHEGLYGSGAVFEPRRRQP